MHAYVAVEVWVWVATHVFMCAYSALLFFFFLLVYLFFVSLIDVLLCPCASRLSVHISVLARAIKQIISVSVLVFKASDPSWQQSNDAACLADRF